ncbi:MAG: hypothetical protein AB7G23_21340, partial [Vicinamibacterales bacterium]
LVWDNSSRNVGMDCALLLAKDGADCGRRETLADRSTIDRGEEIPCLLLASLSLGEGFGGSLALATPTWRRPGC